MGYSEQMVIVKKHVYEKVMQSCPDKSIAELYEKILWKYNYSDEFNVSEKDASIVLLDTNIKVFSLFLDGSVSDNCRVVSQHEFENFRKHVEDYLKERTLLDVVNGQVDQSLMNNVIAIGKALREHKVDFNTECLVVVRV